MRSLLLSLMLGAWVGHRSTTAESDSHSVIRGTTWYPEDSHGNSTDLSTRGLAELNKTFDLNYTIKKDAKILAPIVIRSFQMSGPLPGAKSEKDMEKPDKGKDDKDHKKPGLGTSTGWVLLTLRCHDCRTLGHVTIAARDPPKHDEDKDDDFIESYEHEVEDIALDLLPDRIEDIFRKEYVVDLKGIQGHFEFEFEADGAMRHSFELFHPQTELGVGHGAENIGLNLVGELIIVGYATVKVDFGFNFTLPDSQLIFRPIGNDKIEHHIHAPIVHEFPTAVYGLTRLQVVLRLRVSIGGSVGVMGKGIDVEAGAYTDLTRLDLVLDDEKACALSFSAIVGIYVGAYFEAVVKVGKKILGPQPATEWPIYTTAVASTCLKNITASTLAPVTPTLVKSPAHTTIGRYTEQVITGTVKPPTPTKSCEWNDRIFHGCDDMYEGQKGCPPHSKYNHPHCWGNDDSPMPTEPPKCEHKLFHPSCW
ncbi:MAG: hypothetical protein M1818_006089 [Claussenomyces sp. TS43310]|nr:MAG: hypothetical protein M1818_006089 [Claussenomyces sp. TS43310]